MVLARRRCHSEQLASRPSSHICIIPPHKAAKIREAQLRRDDDGPCLRSSVSPWSTSRHSSSNKEQLTNRKGSAPTIPSHPLISSGKLHDCKSMLPNAGDEQQLDGVANLPSIDAVIAGSKHQDKKKAMIETEFHKRTDKNGTSKQTSILKPVNKEDCLVTRGANPRTGLITPEANSVADSLDFGQTPVKERRGASAQWRLEGDQWVSVMVQEQAGRVVHPEKLRGNCLTDTMIRHPSLEHANRTIRRDLSPLTQLDLQAVANQVRPVSTETQSQAPSETPLSARKIRRKPLRSPPESNIDRHAVKPPHRQPSNETVVHTPHPQGNDCARGNGATYFRPEDVGNANAIRTQTHPRDNAYNESSFLGMPVKSRSTTMGPGRDFIGSNMNPSKRQQSLRTSSGPYPLPASRQNPVSSEMYEDLSRRFQPRKQRLARGALQQEQRACRQPVSKACLPDAAVLHDHARLPSHHTDLETIQARKMGSICHLREGAVALRAEADPDLAPEIEMSTDKPFYTTCTSTNTPTPTFSIRMNRNWSACHSEGALLKQVRQPQAIGESHERSVQPPTTIPIVRRTSISRPLRDEKLEVERRASLGPRVQASRRTATASNERTTMALTDQSNKIGMEIAQSSDDDASVDTQELDENIPPYPVGTGIPTEPGDKLVVFEARKFEIPTLRVHKEHDQRDHSICCPECCVQFDCHEGCLGHPSPAASIADCETSSLVSTGVFDPTFNTSVEAVNEVLLGPLKDYDSKFARIRTAFLGGPRPKLSPLKKTSIKQGLMKRTLRNMPVPQETAQRQIRDSRELEANLAITAAVRAMDAEDSSQEKAIRGKEPGKKLPTTQTKHVSQKQGKTRQAGPEANEGRRASSKAEVCQLQSTNCSEEGLVTPASRNVLEEEENARTSTVGSLGSLLRSPVIVRSFNETRPALLNHVQVVTIRLKEMVFVVLDTTSVMSAMLFEYNRNGTIAVPDGTSAPEVLGNCLRTTLYLMIAMCIYALVVKVLKVVLVFLRVALIPFKICAWIIG